MSRLTRTALVSLAALSLGVAGCDQSDDDEGSIPRPTGATAFGSGDDDGSFPEAQPVPGTDLFGEGDFDQIPLPPLAEPISEIAVQGDSTAQSYEVRGFTAEALIDFYRERLADDDWDQVGSIVETGPDAFRGVWQKTDQRLEVSAGPAPGLGEQETAGREIIQFNLLLRPT